MVENNKKNRILFFGDFEIARFLKKKSANFDI
jgi:hypothetical protein